MEMFGGLNQNTFAANRSLVDNLFILPIGANARHLSLMNHHL